MVPSAFVRLEKFPLTPNSKLDRKALPAPGNSGRCWPRNSSLPHTAVEKQLAALWCELCSWTKSALTTVSSISAATRSAVVRMVTQYHARFGREIPAVNVFQYPTISQLADFLRPQKAMPISCPGRSERANRHRCADCRACARAARGHRHRRHERPFPRRSQPRRALANLCNSVESISFFAPEELGPGIEENLRNDPDYVRARGLIDGADLFDAASSASARLKPRSWIPSSGSFWNWLSTRLKTPATIPSATRGRIGVFAGIGDNHYYTTNLLTHPDLLAMAGKLAVEYGNEKDYIALRAAYLLDLRGPAVSLNTACSTTLLSRRPGLPLAARL